MKPTQTIKIVNISITPKSFLEFLCNSSFLPTPLSCQFSMNCRSVFCPYRLVGIF